MYAVRYTLEADAARHESVLRWVKKESDGYLVVQHDADEEVSATHWHMLLRTNKKKNAVRESFRRALEGIDKTMYSMKEGNGDVETYERYMCHGNGKGDVVKIIAAHGVKYTQEWAQEQNAAYWDARAEFKKNIKKKGKESTIDELVSECRSQNVETVRGVVTQVYLLFKRQKRVFNEVYMSQVVKGVCAQLEIGRYRQTSFVERMMENFFLE